MKILQVMAGNEHGGAETAFVDMCIAMKEAGAEIVVATRPNPARVPALEKAGIPVHTMPFGGPLDIVTRWKLARLIRAERPLVVQTWMARAAQKTPNWTSVKSKQRYLVFARLGGYYKIKNFKSADYFSVITPDIKRHLVEGGISEERIRVINNFAETQSDPGTPVAPVKKSDFGTPEDAPVVLTLARLHTSKALDVLLKALVDLPGVYAWLAGEGPQRKELETLAASLGVKNRVRFLGWRTDRAGLLRTCDICVFASRVEPFGTVFAQAWAEKTPVIVSDADGPRQFCRDEEDSLMVPRDDPHALANAIWRLMADKPLQQRLVEAGYQRYINEFTKEKSVQSYLDFFTQMLKTDKIL